MASFRGGFELCGLGCYVVANVSHILLPQALLQESFSDSQCRVLGNVIIWNVFDVCICLTYELQYDLSSVLQEHRISLRYCHSATYHPSPESLLQALLVRNTLVEVDN